MSPPQQKSTDVRCLCKPQSRDRAMSRDATRKQQCSLSVRRVNLCVLKTSLLCRLRISSTKSSSSTLTCVGKLTPVVFISMIRGSLYKSGASFGCVSSWCLSCCGRCADSRAVLALAEHSPCCSGPHTTSVVALKWSQINHRHYPTAYTGGGGRAGEWGQSHNVSVSSA